MGGPFARIHIREMIDLESPAVYGVQLISTYLQNTVSPFIGEKLMQQISGRWCLEHDKAQDQSFVIHG